MDKNGLGSDLPYPPEAGRMTIEEQASLCRGGLGTSLREVHELTCDPRCAAELLLQRMNGVLCAAAETNFGEAGSYGSVDSLYESIGRMQHGMIAHCEDLAFLYFTRSFAVVMEEAVRQLQQARGTIPCDVRYGPEYSSWNQPLQQRVTEEEPNCSEEHAAAAAAEIGCNREVDSDDESEMDSNDVREVDSQDEGNCSFFSVD